MRVVHLAAGAGRMYCGACARDMVLARALLRRGHDFQIIPLYTPLRIEGEADVTTGPVFLGGINAWLQQQSGIFRRLPSAWDRLLDTPSLLNWVSRFAISTRPSQLGPMTVSVLAGRDGRQLKEFDRLLMHLDREPSPDLFSITNSMLSGVAPPLRARHGKPIVCGLQGEETFVASLPDRYRAEAVSLMRRNAAAVDLFMAPSETSASEMADLLEVGRDRVAVVRPGLDLASLARRGPRVIDPFVLGYLSVIIPGKGLDLLIRAWTGLVREGRDIRLRVAGQPLSTRYYRQVRDQVRAAGLEDHCEWLGEVDLATKLEFVHGCSAFCVPSLFAESRGIAVMEAMAAGVPVIAPASGVYPEAFQLLGGGATFPPGDTQSLAAAIASIQDHCEEADATAARVLAAMPAHFSADAMASAFEASVSGLVGG